MKINYTLIKILVNTFSGHHGHPNLPPAISSVRNEQGTRICNQT